MEEKKSDAAAPQGKSGSRLILIIVAIVIAAGAAGGGVWFMTRSAGSPASSAAKGEHDEHGGAPAGAKPGQVQYVALDPAFVVNLADDSDGRYLQVEVKLMSKDPAAAELIEQHGPLIRNRLLLLFGQKKAEELRTRENKEALQADALAEVRKVFSAETGHAVVDALYFTSFVIQ